MFYYFDLFRVEKFSFNFQSAILAIPPEDAHTFSSNACSGGNTKPDATAYEKAF